MSSAASPAIDTTDPTQEPAAPACVMSFNASDPSGAGGLAGDVSTIAAMGAHALPVVTSIVMRDTAEIFDHHPLDADTVAEQARSVLEDITLSGWKVGFLGSAETVSAVAEVLSDYPDLPLVSYLPPLGWLDEDQLMPYLDAFRELILPATEVLVGNHKTLQDFLLPEWDSERPASPRELAVAAGEHGTRYVLVTGIMLASKGSEQFIDNVLASLLAAGSELQAAVGEALTFLDQSLDAGFRPGMGNVLPDRFFWAMPPAEEGEAPAGEEEGPLDDTTTKPVSRRVH